MATPLSPTSLANIATGQTCVSLSAASRSLGMGGGGPTVDDVPYIQLLRRLTPSSFTRVELGIAVDLPIAPGQQAPRDPSTTAQVQSVLTALSPLTLSATSNATSLVVAPFVLAANVSAATVTASTTSVTYASLPPGTTVAAQQSATGDQSDASLSLAAIVGVAVGGAVLCAVLVGVVIYLMQRRTRVEQEPADPHAPSSLTSLKEGRHGQPQLPRQEEDISPPLLQDTSRTQQLESQQELTQRRQQVVAHQSQSPQQQHIHRPPTFRAPQQQPQVEGPAERSPPQVTLSQPQFQGRRSELHQPAERFAYHAKRTTSNPMLVG